MIPTRYTNLAAARQRHGGHVDTLAPFLLRTDPPAEEVVAVFAGLPPGRGRKMLEAALADGVAAVRDAPRALRDLFAQVEDVPLWVDWEQLDLGGATYRRCGITGGVVLACCSLPLIYCSPAGNKPLVFSGRLVQRAARRLGETARFVVETCMPGGLRRGGLGWQITVKVRLMHAQVRRLLLQSGRWDSAAWGAPINQVDMARTNLLFSVAMLDNLRRVGFRFAGYEGESLMQLWRYSGHLLGIAPELLCATEGEGRRLWELIVSTEGPPDRDAGELTRALMETALPQVLVPGGGGGRWVVPFCYGLSHTLLGRELAQGLQYPTTRWRYAARLALRALVGPVEVCRRVVPGVHALAVRLGTRRIRRSLAANLAAAQAQFTMPGQLDGKRPEQE